MRTKKTNVQSDNEAARSSLSPPTGSDEHRAEWIDQAYEYLMDCTGGKTDTPEEESNMRAWAESLADGEESYYAEGYSPSDAVTDELSNA